MSERPPRLQPPRRPPVPAGPQPRRRPWARRMRPLPSRRSSRRSSRQPPGGAAWRGGRALLWAQRRPPGAPSTAARTPPQPRRGPEAAPPRPGCARAWGSAGTLPRAAARQGMRRRAARPQAGRAGAGCRSAGERRTARRTCCRRRAAGPRRTRRCGAACAAARHPAPRSRRRRRPRRGRPSGAAATLARLARRSWPLAACARVAGLDVRGAAPAAHTGLPAALPLPVRPLRRSAQCAESAARVGKAGLPRTGTRRGRSKSAHRPALGEAEKRPACTALALCDAHTAAATERLSRRARRKTQLEDAGTQACTLPRSAQRRACSAAV